MPFHPAALSSGVLWAACLDLHSQVTLGGATWSPSRPAGLQFITVLSCFLPVPPNSPQGDGAAGLPAQPCVSGTWRCTQHVGGAPPVFPGVWVHVCTCECVCVRAHPHTGTSHTPGRSVGTTSTWARTYAVQWLPVTEHILPSLGALWGHSQPQAHPEGSPPSWHRPTLQMATWAGTGAPLVSDSA